MRFRDRRRMFAPKAPSKLSYAKATRCCWCNLPLRRKGRRSSGKGGPHRGTQATREHYLPRSLGGRGGDNLLAACARCNNRRGSDTTWVLWRDVPDWQRRVGVAYRRSGDDVEPLWQPT